MESSTFRQWLAEHGCRFDSHRQKGRSHDHPVIMVHREARMAELPLLGRHQHLDERVVNDICAALGLDPSELPGPQGRV